MNTSFCNSINRVFSVLAMISMTAFAQASFADTIAMIGTGSVGSALGKDWSQRGHTIVYGSRNPGSESVQALVAATSGDASATTQAEAVIGADVVVVAVPWEVGEQVVAGLGDLSGKIVIDPTNPRDVSEDGLSVPPSQESNTEKFKKLAPGAYFAKSFNHIAAEFMENPEQVPGFFVSVAGDEPAVQWISNIATDMGYTIGVVGGLRETRLLEAFYSAMRNLRTMGYPAVMQYGDMPSR
ncbi:MAG: NAD(P)-binding domain-containing protein [Proteobacteria bacterium]|jgi:8-hydroxy-5-deazaflavin:NADPH oxidoreductase|nr:NAD(P)-binding domain-containing protein [Pseudomonadota bacterium]